MPVFGISKFGRALLASFYEKNYDVFGIKHSVNRLGEIPPLSMGEGEAMELRGEGRENDSDTKGHPTTLT